MSNSNFWNIPETVPGKWAAQRRLAGALRELIAISVVSDAPETEVSAAADAVRALSERLRAHPRRNFKEEHDGAREATDLHEFADRGVLVGQCNPLAPPMRFLPFDGTQSIGHVVFGAPYEGAPGWVHGGIVAAAFDQALGHLQVNLDVPSLTGVLTIHYRKPTPLHTELRFESRVARRDGRKNFVTGQCFAGDRLTAEAEGVFIEVYPDRMREMIQQET